MFSQLELSVIIPTLNEMELGIFPRLVESFSGFDNIEVIVSDGGSSDGTLDIAEKKGFKIISTPLANRAERLNRGIELAQSGMLLLNHPRSIIEREGVAYLISNLSEVLWGGFTHRFDSYHPALKFTSWYSNIIRGGLFGVLYLDHCIFLKKFIYDEIGGIPNVDIFEDTLLSREILKCYEKPTILPYISKTSAVRFMKNGIYRQALLNQYMKIALLLGKDHKEMNSLYERGLSLNIRSDEGDKSNFIGKK